MIAAGLKTPKSTKNGEKVRNDYCRAKDTNKYEERRER